MLHRRGFLSGIFSAFAAPAIIRVESLMPVKAMPTAEELLALRMRAASAAISENLYGELMAVTRKAFIPRLFVQLYREAPSFDYLLTESGVA